MNLPLKKIGLVVLVLVVVIYVFLSLNTLVVDSAPVPADPIAEASKMVKNLISKPRIPQSSKLVFYEYPATSARMVAITSGVLNEGQVCVLAGQSAGSDFTSTDGKVVIYTGNSRSIRKLYVMCDIEKEIGNTVNSLIQSDLGKSRDAFANVSRCAFDNSRSDKVCIVSVISAGT